MKKKSLVVFGTILFCALTVGVTQAQNPQFKQADPVIDASGDLNVTFVETGLGNVSSANITLTATVTSTFGCVNPGNGQQPQGLSSTTTTPTASGTFPARNGQTRGTITLSAPDTPECPKPMTGVLVSITYSNIQISGAGATVKLGTLTRSFY
jgi:hypothetical protein